MSGLTSSPGISTPNNRAARLSWVKSLISALPAPGYWILTATSRPSFHTARCTWPMDAAAAGLVVEEAKLLAPVGAELPAREPGARSAAGSGGAASCSLVSVARYGPAISGGSAASKIDNAWPNFIAPPLSSPRTWKICSAVRCWISVRDDLGRTAADALAEPERGAAREPDRQRGHYRGPGHRVLGHVVHMVILPHRGVRMVRVQRALLQRCWPRLGRRSFPARREPTRLSWRQVSALTYLPRRTRIRRSRH